MFLLIFGHKVVDFAKLCSTFPWHKSKQLPTACCPTASHNSDIQPTNIYCLSPHGRQVSVPESSFLCFGNYKSKWQNSSFNCTIFWELFLFFHDHRKIHLFKQVQKKKKQQSLDITSAVAHATRLVSQKGASESSFRALQGICCTEVNTSFTEIVWFYQFMHWKYSQFIWFKSVNTKEKFCFRSV